MGNTKVTTCNGQNFYKCRIILKKKERTASRNFFPYFIAAVHIHKVKSDCNTQTNVLRCHSLQKINTVWNLDFLRQTGEKKQQNNLLWNVQHLSFSTSNTYCKQKSAILKGKIPRTSVQRLVAWATSVCKINIGSCDPLGPSMGALRASRNWVVWKT